MIDRLINFFFGLSLEALDRETRECRGAQLSALDKDISSLYRNTPKRKNQQSGKPLVAKPFYPKLNTKQEMAQEINRGWNKDRYKEDLTERVFKSFNLQNGVLNRFLAPLRRYLIQPIITQAYESVQLSTL